MYESADQKEPVYDAKGIETVRRDGCPAVAKVFYFYEQVITDVTCSFFLVYWNLKFSRTNEISFCNSLL